MRKNAILAWKLTLIDPLRSRWTSEWYSIIDHLISNFSCSASDSEHRRAQPFALGRPQLKSGPLITQHPPR